MTPPLLIASVGNPAPYLQTLHSAGHTLLHALALYLRAPPLLKDRSNAGLSTTFHPSPDFTSTSDFPPPITLFQSTSFMNISGKGIAGAWRGVAGVGQQTAQLVVLHDELELPIGRFSVKRGKGLSARGHNGLKSLLGMPGMKELDFVRVGVGIGPRPLSRDPDVVAGFVLKRMNGEDKRRVEDLAADVWTRVVKAVEK